MSDDSEYRWTDQFDDEVIVAARDAASAVLARHGVMLQAFVVAVDFMGANGETGWIAGGPDDQLHRDTLSLFEHGAAYHGEIRRLGFHKMLLSRDDDDD